MKNTIKILAIAALVVLASCKKVDASKGVSKDHQVSLNGFSGIELGISGDLDFTESATTDIVVNTNDVTFHALDIFLKDDILHIEVKDGYAIKNPTEIKTTITAPDINSLTLTGSGDIDAEFDSTIEKSIVKIENSGSGDITTSNITTESIDFKLVGSGRVSNNNLTTEVSTADITGSGGLRLNGTCNNSIMELTGSGIYQGFGFETNTVNAVINGSGSCQVKANSSINVTISGSGSLLYKGDPIISSSISGTGTVIDAN